jgi:hypothetical protein
VFGITNNDIRASEFLQIALHKERSISVRGSNQMAVGRRKTNFENNNARENKKGGRWATCFRKRRFGVGERSGKMQEMPVRCFRAGHRCGNNSLEEFHLEDIQPL